MLEKYSSLEPLPQICDLVTEVVYLGHLLSAVVLSRGDFCLPGGVSQCLETFFDHHDEGERERVVFVGRGQSQRPGLLLNIPHCTAQAPARKNYLAPNVSSAQAEKPCPSVINGAETNG